MFIVVVPPPLTDAGLKLTVTPDEQRQFFPRDLAIGPPETTPPTTSRSQGVYLTDSARCIRDSLDLV